MSPLGQHVQFEVPCPTCTDSFTVPLEIVEESQRLLDELGPCSGLASYECPVTYFAGLVTKNAIVRLEVALRELAQDATLHGVKPVWVEEDAMMERRPRELLVLEGGALGGRDDERPSESEATSKRSAGDRELARELARWEEEGGAVGRS